jgi:hypothetical protein
MQKRTTRPGDPAAVGDGRIVEREVETVRTRERAPGAPADAITAPRAVDGETAPRAVDGERSGGYFETLPERLSAVALVVLTLIEGLLGMRFLLHAFGANPNSGFVGFIDDVSWPFARPFANVFSNRSWDQGVVEVSTLVAMVFYLLLFALIGMLVAALAPRLRGGTGGAA